MQADGVIYNANIATFDPQSGANYGLIPNGSVAWRNRRIVYVGNDIEPGVFTAAFSLDARGKLLTPGLIDCHTHLVYGGDRAQEFESRLGGKSYESIAREGGGIMSTVAATRQCDFQELLALSNARLVRLAESGVTTLEIKSGYGLNFADEIKCLEVIQALKKISPLTIQATCLAAHTLPQDFSGSKDDYIDWVCRELLPEIKTRKLADAVDIFCETIAFTPAQAQRLFKKARELGFALKGHVEQLSQSHGTEVLCEYGGLSADHLEYADEEQVIKMKDHSVTPVLLPGAFYYLNEIQKPPVELIRQHNVPMAVATDLNPGSSPVFSITTAANMACVLFGLTPEEALQGITCNAARALGLKKRKGSIREGLDADIILWPGSMPNVLVYEQPALKPERIWISGNEQ